MYDSHVGLAGQVVAIPAANGTESLVWFTGDNIRKFSFVAGSLDVR